LLNGLRVEWVEAEKEMANKLKKKSVLQKAPEQPGTISEEEEEEASEDAVRR
jgi:hypothetical protein